MSEHEQSHGHAAGDTSSVDRELSLKGIVLFGIVLALLLVATGGVILLLSGSLRERIEATDPPLAVLPEARRAPEQPEPALQSDPEADMAAMHAEEKDLLGSYAWVDEAAGIARVPIERAMEIVARDGLESAPAPAALAEEPAANGEGENDPPGGG
jgi:hypothetical protein